MKTYINIISTILLIFSLLTTLLLIKSDNAFSLEILIYSYCPKIAPDGHGGAFVTLSEPQDPQKKHIYIQYMNSTGNFTWEGLGIETTIPKEHHYEIASDEQGNMIIVWEDTKDRIQGLYAQKIDSTGNYMWDDKGVLVHERTGGEYPGWLWNLWTVPDKDGGVIVFWQYIKEHNPIYTQKIDASGKIAWNKYGIIITQKSYHYLSPMSVSDESGGAIIIWQVGPQEDVPGETYQIFTQKIDESGNPLWGENGIQIGNEYAQCQAASDSEGGVIVAVNNGESIYILSIDYSGSIYHGYNSQTKVPLIIGGNDNPNVLSDNKHGAFVVWNEMRSPEDCNLYAQRVDIQGDTLWGQDSVAICTEGGFKNNHQVISDGFGGFIVSWQDTRDDGDFIYIQRVDSNGKILWAENGIRLTRLNIPVRNFSMFSNGSGAIILGEEGSDTEPRLFAQLINYNGGFTQPETSLYPPGLPRVIEKVELDYGALYTEPSVWHWLLPVLIILVALPIIVTIFRGVIRKGKLNNKNKSAS